MVRNPSAKHLVVYGDELACLEFEAALPRQALGSSGVASKKGIAAGVRQLMTTGTLPWPGRGSVGRAVAGSDLSREELSVTTKLWNRDHGHQLGPN